MHKTPTNETKRRNCSVKTLRKKNGNGEKVRALLNTKRSLGTKVQLQIFFAWYALHIGFLSRLFSFWLLCIASKQTSAPCGLHSLRVFCSLVCSFTARGAIVCVTLIHKTFIFAAKTAFNAHIVYAVLCWNMSPSFHSLFSLITLCVFCHCNARACFMLHKNNSTANHQELTIHSRWC